MITPTLPAPLNDGNVVTASDLVRHFGVWQERASREPVYVLHRGRPRFVLTSVDIMQALCAPHRADQRGRETLEPGVGVDALFDLIRDIVLIVDHEHHVVAASHTARRYFGEALRIGASLATIVRSASSALLVDAVDRVRASGNAEAIDIAAPYPQRSMTVAIDAIRSGTFLRFHDLTMVDELAALRTEHLAASDALHVTGLAATGQINMRGYLEAPLDSVARLAGVDPAALVGTRFIALVSQAARSAVGQAIESVIDTRQPIGLNADLIVSGGHFRPVRLGFSAVGRGPAVEGVRVAIIAS